jgi:hypothetical protein
MDFLNDKYNSRINNLIIFLYYYTPPEIFTKNINFINKIAWNDEKYIKQNKKHMEIGNYEKKRLE